MKSIVFSDSGFPKCRMVFQLLLSMFAKLHAHWSKFWKWDWYPKQCPSSCCQSPLGPATQSFHFSHSGDRNEPWLPSDESTVCSWVTWTLFSYTSISHANQDSRYALYNLVLHYFTPETTAHNNWMNTQIHPRGTCIFVVVKETHWNSQFTKRAKIVLYWLWSYVLIYCTYFIVK